MKINDVECFRTLDIAVLNKLHPKTLNKILLDKKIIKWNHDIYSLVGEYLSRSEELTKVATYRDKSGIERPYLVWTEAGRQLINSILENMNESEINSYKKLH